MKRLQLFLGSTLFVIGLIFLLENINPNTFRWDLVQLSWPLAIVLWGTAQLSENKLWQSMIFTITLLYGVIFGLSFVFM